MQYNSIKKIKPKAINTHTERADAISSAISSTFALNMIQQSLPKQNFNNTSKRSHPKSKFTPEEDEMLKEIVNNYINSNCKSQNPDNNSESLSEYMIYENTTDDVLSLDNIDWNDIALQMKTERNARQCRERWINYLSPSVINGPWTDEEDDLLCQKYNEIGAHWKKIAIYFPTRTDINVKSRYHLLERRRNKEEKKRLKAIKKEQELEEMNQRNLLLNSINNRAKCDLNNFVNPFNPMKLTMPEIQNNSSNIFPFIPYHLITNENIIRTSYGDFKLNDILQQRKPKQNKKQKEAEKSNLKLVENQNQPIKESQFSLPNSEFPSSFWEAEKEFEANANVCWNSLLMNDESNEVDSFFDVWN